MPNESIHLPQTFFSSYLLFEEQSVVQKHIFFIITLVQVFLIYIVKVEHEKSEIIIDKNT